MVGNLYNGGARPSQNLMAAISTQHQQRTMQNPATMAPKFLYTAAAREVRLAMTLSLARGDAAHRT